MAMSEQESSEGANPSQPSPVLDLGKLADSEKAITRIMGTAKIFSERMRIRIMKLLAEQGEASVLTLAHALKESQPAISHHLAILLENNAVHYSERGKYNYYSLKDPQRIVAIVHAAEACVHDIHAKRSGQPFDEHASVMPPVMLYQEPEPVRQKLAPIEAKTRDLSTTPEPVAPLHSMEPVTVIEEVRQEPMIQKKDEPPVLEPPAVAKQSRARGKPAHPDKEVASFYKELLKKVDLDTVELFANVWQFATAYPEVDLLKPLATEWREMETVDDTFYQEVLTSMLDIHNVTGYVYSLIRSRIPETHRQSFDHKWLHENYTDKIAAFVSNGTSLLKITKDIGREIGDRWKMDSLREWK